MAEPCKREADSVLSLMWHKQNQQNAGMGKSIKSRRLSLPARNKIHLVIVNDKVLKFSLITC